MMSFLSTPTPVLSDRSNHSIGKLASIPMTMNTTLFSYEELQGPCAFRLLDLLPGQRVDPICCTIKHASVASRPEFYALSYCWGAASDREHIWIDGKLLAIQSNLHEFLIELRLLDRPRTIWADAICINQGDIAERTTQIALMRDIYSAAQTVMVWLGPHDADSLQLFDCFELIAANSASVQTSGSRDLKQNLFQAFEKLMSRPYWRRTWIIQEIVLANNIRLFCGNASTPWLDFVAMYKEWFKETTPASQPQWYRPTNKSRGYRYSVEALEMLVDLRKRDAQPFLLDMMDWNHPFECFDFRDCVYGVLGFVADGADFLPLVDYHCSAEELFLSVLKTLKLHKDRSLYNFITRIHILATRISLDLVHCADFAKVLKSTKSKVFDSFDPIADAYCVRKVVESFASSDIIVERESEFQPGRTSQILRKYHMFKRYDVGRGDVIAKAKLLPGDWLILLHPIVAPNGPSNTLHKDQGVYGIYRHSPLCGAGGVSWRDWLVDYCVLIESGEFNARSWYERAAYEFFDNEVLNPQDKVSALKTPQGQIGCWRTHFHIPMSEILKISTFQGYIYSAASQPVSRIDWRKVKTKESPGIQIVMVSDAETLLKF